MFPVTLEFSSVDRNIDQVISLVLSYHILMKIELIYIIYIYTILYFKITYKYIVIEKKETQRLALYQGSPKEKRSLEVTINMILNCNYIVSIDNLSLFSFCHTSAASLSC